MVIRLGSDANPNNLYVGNQSVSRIYKGDQQVWPTTVVSSESADINIVHRSMTQEAPEGIVFEVDNWTGFATAGPNGAETYDPRLHDMYYVWDFDDSYNFTAPQNLSTEFMDAGISYGPKVSHTFRSPGTYNVTCQVVEPATGRSALASLSVTVDDPAANYTGTNTIFVDSTGVGTGAPVGASIETSLNAALASLDGSGAGQHRRIMLKRGQTFTENGLQSIGLEGVNRMNVFICAEPGGGAKPIVNMQGSFGWYGGEPISSPSTFDVDLRIQDIDFNGPWDSTTGTGATIGFIEILTYRPHQMLIDNVELSGFDLAIIANFNDVVTGDTGLILNDSVITNWKSTGIYGSQDNMIIVATGNRMSQDVDALNGINGGGNGSTGPVRIAVSPVVIWTSNDHFNRLGWFQNGSPSRFDNQGCFRGNTNSQPDAFYNVSCNSMEGGFRILQFDSSDVPFINLTAEPINAIVEKNYLLGNHNTNIHMRFDYGGVTVRNNVCIYPEAARYDHEGFASFVWMFENGDSSAENFASPINVYNNTFVNLSDVANPAGVTPLVNDFDVPSFTAITEENNVSLQPNRGGTSLANINTATILTPRYTHYEDDMIARDNTVATPAADASLFRQTAANAAIIDQATTGLTAYDDFFGTIRNTVNATPDRGAFEGD